MIDSFDDILSRYHQRVDYFTDEMALIKKQLYTRLCMHAQKILAKKNKDYHSIEICFHLGEGYFNIVCGSESDPDRDNWVEEYGGMDTTKSRPFEIKELTQINQDYIHFADYTNLFLKRRIYLGDEIEQYITPMALGKREMNVLHGDDLQLFHTSHGSLRAKTISSSNGLFVIAMESSGNRKAGDLIS